MKPLDIRTIELTVQQLAASVMIDDDYIPQGNVRVRAMYQLEYLAHAITAALQVPSKVLQDNRLVAQFPDGLWQYVRNALGLPCRMVQIRANEWLTFPTVEVPPIKKPLRIYYAIHPSVVDFRKSDDE